MIAHDRSHASRLLCIDCPIWARFKASGEQDLDGFDDVDEVQGEEEDEDEDMPDDDDDDGDEAAAAKSMAELDAAEQELEGEEGVFARGPVDALAGFSPSLCCWVHTDLPAACLPAPHHIVRTSIQPRA